MNDISDTKPGATKGLIEATEAMGTDALKSLYAALRWVNIETSCLKLLCSQVRVYIKTVDRAPRHDTPLTDPVYDRALRGVNNADRDTLYSARRQVATSIQAAEAAMSVIKGRFRGEERIQSQDKLAHVIGESNILLRTLTTMLDELRVPEFPYQVRQKCLSDLLLQLQGVLVLVSPLKKTLSNRGMPADLFDTLASHEATLLRLRAKIAKWRDNPSQKLGSQMDSLFQEVDKLDRGSEALREDTATELKRRGIKFFNRCGPVN